MVADEALHLSLSSIPLNSITTVWRSSSAAGHISQFYSLTPNVSSSVLWSSSTALQRSHNCQQKICERRLYYLLTALGLTIDHLCFKIHCCQPLVAEVMNCLHSEGQIFTYIIHGFPSWLHLEGSPAHPLSPNQLFKWISFSLCIGPPSICRMYLPPN